MKNKWDNNITTEAVKQRLKYCQIVNKYATVDKRDSCFEFENSV